MLFFRVTAKGDSKTHLLNGNKRLVAFLSFTTVQDGPKTHGVKLGRTSVQFKAVA